MKCITQNIFSFECIFGMFSRDFNGLKKCKYIINVSESYIGYILASMLIRSWIVYILYCICVRACTVKLSVICAIGNC